MAPRRNRKITIEIAEDMRAHDCNITLRALKYVIDSRSLPLGDVTPLIGLESIVEQIKKALLE